MSGLVAAARSHADTLRGVALRGLMAGAGCKRVTFDGVFVDDFNGPWEALPTVTRAGWVRAASLLSVSTQQFAVAP